MVERPRLLRASRFEPYSVRIADTVHKALELQHQQQPSSRQHGAIDPQQSVCVSTTRKRRVLAWKLQLAARSADNMAAYLEQRRARDGATCTVQPMHIRVDESKDCAESACSICCICLEPTRSTESDSHAALRTLPCGHIFHRACICEWMRHRRCCPVDRFELAASDDDDDDS